MLGSGRVIIHTGDGKGKTTAAFGAALRASGHGLKTAVVQFIKGASWDYGELQALADCPNIYVTRIGSGFTWLARDPAEPRALAREAWSVAEEAVLSDQYDIVVLDELNCAIVEGYVGTDEVLSMLDGKPSRLSVIITGRGAPQDLIDVADTVTEMRAVKHGMQDGIAAQKGVEF